jgi:ribonuclease J
VRHAALAREFGIAPDRILVLENGQQVELAPGGVRRTTEVAAGNVFVDGKGLGDVDRVVLRDRQHLAQDGMVIAIVGVVRHSGELVAGPDLVARGIADETETGRLTQAAEAMLRSLLEREARAGRADTQVLQDILRTELKRFFKKESMRFPMIIPVVVET